MINRLTHSNAAAIALQNAAELRRTQSPTPPAAQQPGAQYNFAEIFGGASNWGETEDAEATAKDSLSTTSSHGGFDTAIATATATVVDKGTGQREPVTASAAAGTVSETAAATTTAATTAATASGSTTTTSESSGAVTTPGVEALVSAIMNGSFQATYVTNPSQLQETNPAGTDTMPSFYYASDQTAAQLAQLLGGTVVQRTAFGQDQGWSEPLANFIQLPNGQTFNAADVAYYANAGSEGAEQLTADITATINEGSAWTSYYQQGGQMPTFAEGYVGPPISGSTYASNMIGANGDVINPAMQQFGTQGT
jgi:hypothetical protein